MLVTSKQMILDVKAGKYAVGCFNTSDLEITKAIIAAAEAHKSPVIIATSEKAIQFGGLETLAALICEEASNASVPVALHLDHGKTIDMIKLCLNAGYTSVMIDGSHLPLDENINITSKAVETAHANNVPCEGELGALGKIGSQNQGTLTNPEDVKEFIDKTEVDFLAVSIGSAHGAGDERLDIGLLSKINAVSEVPLVLHGGSGVAEGDIRKAIQNGICKINIDTDIRNEYTKDLREILKEHPEEKDPREILEEVMIKIQKLVENKIKLFGSNNKA